MVYENLLGKMEADDVLHMRELCRFYEPAAMIPALPRTKYKHAAVGLNPPRLDLLPYTCCSETFVDQGSALDHYFGVHFRYIWRHFHSRPRPPFDKKVLADGAIPLFLRAQFFLDSLVHLPATPMRFRPGPPTKKPKEFRNPYSAVMALAYDFLHVVATHPPEYSRFVTRLAAHGATVGHRQVWTYWAAYIFPVACVADPSPKQLPPREPLRGDVFRCWYPFCKEIFLNQILLNDHTILCHLI